MKLVLLESRDLQELSYEVLKKHGMKYPPQSPGKVNDELGKFIDQYFGEK